jgi:hypothetical protein
LPADGHRVGATGKRTLEEPVEMTVAEIWRYPVKTMAGELLRRARIGPLGIEGDRVVHVAFQRLDQRLAGLLLGRAPVLHITHQQLADELGSVREIVSRLLKGFAEQGLVTLGRERIEVCDAAGLRRVAGAAA